MIQRLLLILFACGIIGITFAATPAQQLENQLMLFHSMTAQFKQVIHSQDGTVLQEVSGTAAIKRPGKFLWKTTKPLTQTILTDGKKLWIYDPDLKQAMIQNLPDNIDKTPIILLADPKANLNKNFMIETLSIKKGVHWFKLIPKRQESFSKIEIGLKNGVPYQMRLFNQLDQTTEIMFTKTEINSKIDDSLFSLNLPKSQHIDIIDQTNK